MRSLAKKFAIVILGFILLVVALDFVIKYSILLFIIFVVFFLLKIPSKKFETKEEEEAYRRRKAELVAEREMREREDASRKSEQYWRDVAEGKRHPSPLFETMFPNWKKMSRNKRKR